MNSKKVHVAFLIKESYVAMIKNSHNTSLFKHAYARVNGKKKDIMRDGDLSCAYYASSLLTLFQLTKTPHATVKSTLTDMQTCGWYTIQRPKVGCVLVWGEKFFAESGETHPHIGFYIGKNQAVSNSSRKKCVSIHSYKEYGGRPLIAMYWHPILD